MQRRRSAAMGEITTSVHACVVCKAHHSTMNDDEGGPSLCKAHHSSIKTKVDPHYVKRTIRQLRRRWTHINDDDPFKLSIKIVANERFAATASTHSRY